MVIRGSLGPAPVVSLTREEALLHPSLTDADGVPVRAQPAGRNGGRGIAAVAVAERLDHREVRMARQSHALGARVR
jgi:hypothetical protein